LDGDYYTYTGDKAEGIDAKNIQIKAQSRSEEKALCYISEK
jgi:hypothetical protein